MMHTPTPWHLGNFREVKDTFYAKPDNVDSIGMIFCSNRTPEGAQADAAFIVKAVNNHEALNAHAISNSTIASEERLRACDKEVLIALLGVIRNQALAAAKGDA